MSSIKKKSQKKNNKRNNKLSKTQQLKIRLLKLKKRSGRRPVPLSAEEKERVALQQIFSSFTSDEIFEQFQELARSGLIKKSLNLTLIGSASNILNQALPYTSDFSKDISWCFGILIKHKELLNEFFIETQSLTKAVLLSKTSVAERILFDIDTKFGRSIWSEKLWACFIADKKTDKKECKEPLSSRLRSNREVNEYLSYLLDKFEYYIDRDAFISSLENDMKDITRMSSDEYKASILYHLSPFHMVNPNYQGVFALEKSTSIIDVFECFLSYLLSRELFSNGPKSDFDKTIVNSLSQNINAPLLKNIRCIYDQNYAETIEPLKEYFEISNHYLNGDYLAAIEAAESIGLETLPFPVIEMVAKSSLRARPVKQDGLLGQIIDFIKSVLKKDKDYFTSIQELEYLSYKYRSLSWFKDLQIFSIRESAYQTEADLSICSARFYLNNNWFSIEEEKFFGFGFSNSINAHLGNLKSVRLFKEMKLSKGGKIKSLGLPKELLMHYLNTLKISQGKYTEVIENLHMISSGNGDELIQLESKRNLVNCLIHCNKVGEAAKIFVDDYFCNKDRSVIYEIKFLLNKSENLIKTSKDIDYSICLSLYSRNIDNLYDSKLKFSFSSFLSKNKLNKPRELFGSELSYGRDRLHYFFKYVCTPENMRLHLGFSDPEEIINARVSICNYLIKKGDKSSSLSNEIFEIEKRKAEKVTLAIVDKSRVHVDTGVFSGRDSGKFRTLFDRYLDLAKSDHSNENDEKLFETLFQSIKNDNGLDASDWQLTRKLTELYLRNNISLNKKNSIFLGISKLFREEFAFGEKGLNGHLSTRIRHGYLPTALQKPFKDECLFFASKESKSTLFSESKWADGIISFNEKEAIIVNDHLASFSKSLEEHIDLINDEWLQIYTTDPRVSQIKNVGGSNKRKINFSITPIECYSVEKKLPISPKYEDLVNVMIDWLWSKADFSFILIVNLIRNETQSHVLALTDKLNNSLIETLDNSEALGEICNSIARAKLRMSSQIDLVCSWFERGGLGMSDVEYDISSLIDIASRSLSVYVTIEPSKKLYVSGKFLNHIVDVFHILFENAISKSGVPKDKLGLSVSIRSSDRYIEVIVKNNCIYTDIDVGNIGFYKDAYGNETLIKDAIQLEGGTGFFKIWKIIEKDLEIDHKIDMTYKEGNIFLVTLKIPQSDKLYTKNEKNTTR